MQAPAHVITPNLVVLVEEFEADYQALLVRFAGPNDLQNQQKFIKEWRVLALDYENRFHNLYRDENNFPGLNDLLASMRELLEGGQEDPILISLLNARYRDLIIEEMRCFRIMQSLPDTYQILTIIALPDPMNAHRNVLGMFPSQVISFEDWVA